MRSLAWSLVAALVLLTVLPGPARASTADLVLQLDALLRGAEGLAGLYVADPALPAPLYVRSADEPVITASLYKLAVLVEAERRVEAGTLTYATAITIEREDITADGSYEPAGTELRLDDALEAMITLSDNGTALALWRILTPVAINATLVSAGIRDFHVALDSSEDNVATPRAVGTLLTLLARRTLISPAASDRMLARLARQTIRDRLPSQLPETVRVANKTGNLTGLTHDAGIIYTPSGPRVVVAMTWDLPEAQAVELISTAGALVYAAVLEPPANASYIAPRGPLYAEAGTTRSIPLVVTNRGSRAWDASGPGSVGLLWELRDGRNALVAGSGAVPLPLGPLAPGAAADTVIELPVPRALGDHRLSYGLMDGSGRALGPLGAAVESLVIRVHQPFVVNALVRLPAVLHRGQAHFLSVDFGRLPAAGNAIHSISLAWRAVDPKTRRVAASGSTFLGNSHPQQGGGTFFASLVAPNLRGSYLFEYELRERGRIASETQAAALELVSQRTYPDDRDSFPVEPAIIRAPRPGPRATPLPSARGRTPSPSRPPGGR